MQRVIEPELLDVLPPEDPGAIRSRRDLVRVNFWLGHLAAMWRLLRQTGKTRPATVIELGGGDGTFLLRLARRISRSGHPVRAVLVDRQELVTAQTRAAFAGLGWELIVARADVFEWLESRREPSELIVANLFLHHFRDRQLEVLFDHIARLAGVFIACEPRRRANMFWVRLFLRWTGCGEVTRHDAEASVRAGFYGRELSGLWPAADFWELREQRTFFSSHSFLARKLLEAPESD